MDEASLDSVLLTVPLSSPLHPKASMPFLKGYITQKGFRSKIFDTNILFFNWMLKDQDFDIHNKKYIDNPVSLLGLYNQIEDSLTEACSAYRGLGVDLRTINFAYNRTYFKEVIKAIKDADANPMIKFYNEFIETELLHLNPKIVCIGVTFQDNIIAAFTLADRVREKLPSAKIVFGGQIITRCYDKMLADSFLKHLWDYLALWDGELPLLDIHNRVVNSSREPMRNVISQNTDNDTDNGFDLTGRQHGVFDLNETIRPDFDDIDFDAYFFPEMLIPLQTARGCYGSCEFCAIPSGSNFGFRERSVEKLIDDIKYIQELTQKKYGKKATYFKFMDDTSSPRTLFSLAQQIIENGLDAKWETYVRMETPFQELENMELLFQGGCRKLMWGLETNDPQVLKNMNKKVKHISTNKVLDASYEAGILNFVFVLLGFPGETDEQRTNLVDFIAGKESINVLTVATFDVTKHSPMQSSLMDGNTWNLDCEMPKDFEVRLIYTLDGENWKKKIVSYAQKFMLDVTKKRPDIALVSLFPDQVRGILTEKHNNKWGETFLKDFGEENLKKMLQATEGYIDIFANSESGEMELSYLPDPIKREHFRTKDDIQAISKAIARRRRYEIKRGDSI